MNLAISTLLATASVFCAFRGDEVNIPGEEQFELTLSDVQITATQAACEISLSVVVKSKTSKEVFIDGNLIRSRCIPKLQLWQVGSPMKTTVVTHGMSGLDFLSWRRIRGHESVTLQGLLSVDFIDYDMSASRPWGGAPSQTLERGAYDVDLVTCIPWSTKEHEVFRNRTWVSSVNKLWINWDGRKSAPLSTTSQSASTPANQITPVAWTDQTQILDAVLLDVVSNPDLEGTRQFYGSKGAKQIALQSNSDYGVRWPAHYEPNLPGWTVTRVTEDSERDRKKPRLLGIRLDRYFTAGHNHSGMFNATVAVTLFNAGGTPDNVVPIGGCWVFYDPQRIEGKWKANCRGIDDP